MKTYILKVLLCTLFFPYIIVAQSNDFFRPLKQKVYYNSSVNPDWILSNITLFTYNRLGDVVTRIHLDGYNLILSKDSIVYNNNREVVELFHFLWNKDNQQYFYKDKIVTCFEKDGRTCGSRVYKWNNGWDLVSGSDNLYTFDANNNEETIVTKIYIDENNQWVNLVKEVNLFDAQKQLLVKTLYSANPVSKEFEPYSRQTYNGWHNFEKGIYNELTREVYQMDEWLVESKSTIKKAGTLWVQEEEHIKEGIKYKTLFADDNSFRELMKEHSPGWLSISVYSKEGNKETIIENGFSGDILEREYKKEIEKNNFGKILREGVEEVKPDGEIISFTEVVHELKYNTKDQLEEDIGKIKTSKNGEFMYAIKTEYLDYEDVSIVLGSNDEEHHSDLVIYPNPSKGLFKINTNDNIAKVFDIQGKLVHKVMVKEKSIDLSGMARGIYFLQLSDGAKTHRRKIIVE